MVTLQATQAYPYAGRSLKPGDLFDASDQDAAVLKKIGRAIDAPIDAKPKRQYRRRDMTADGS